MRIANSKWQIANSKRGFTLVELLIVIAIIGVLATLLMTNFIAVRQRARDAKRKADIAEIQAALEQYRSDQGTYPQTSQFPSTCGSALQDPTQQTTYMQKIPCDPNGSGYYNSGNYYYTSAGSTYYIYACLENTSDSQAIQYSNLNPAPGVNNCPSTYYYMIQNP